MRGFFNWRRFILFILLFISSYHYFNNGWALDEGNLATQFYLHFLAAILGGLFVAWLGFLFRFKIKKFFGFFDPIIARIPLMLSCAPLFVAMKFKIWEQNDLEVDLDFRYAGVGALEDLKNNKCHIAVASDVATVAFMDKLKGAETDYCIQVLPFVKITNHLKIIVKQDSALINLSDLKNKNIAHLAASVHDDFLRIVERNIDINIKTLNWIAKEDIMKCYHALISGEVDACILWEPHYLALKKYNMRILEDFKNLENSYTWFLCLIAKEKYIDEHPNVAKSIYNVMKSATERCSNSSNDIIDSCSLYLESEFTGLDDTGLREIIDIGKHHFSVGQQMRKDYFIKLDTLQNDYGFGIGKLKRVDALWPNYEY